MDKPKPDTKVVDKSYGVNYYNDLHIINNKVYVLAGGYRGKTTEKVFEAHEIDENGAYTGQTTELV